MKTFWIRTASATVYALLFLGSIYIGRIVGNQTVGDVAFGLFLLFVTCGCTFEFFRIAAQQQARPCRPLGYAFAVIALMALVGLNALSAVHGLILFGTAMTILPMAFIVAAIVQLWYGSEQPFREAAYTLLPMFYVAIPLGLMPLIHSSYNAMVMLIILVWVNDSAAYMGGSWLGKHKMWPRHSPGKTWEGTAIGVLVTALLAVFVGPLFNSGIAWYHWMVLGLICSVVGTLGDLVESMLKRSVGLKDSGNIMPGHGGFLDRFDSLLAITPCAFVYLNLFVSL